MVDFESTAIEMLAEGHEFGLDSLVVHNRWAVYQYLRDELQSCLATGSTEFIALTARLAELVERHYSDPFFVRQVDLYQSWSDSEWGKRRQLDALQVEAIATAPSLPVDSLAHRFDILAGGYLEIADSAAAVQAWQNGSLLLLEQKGEECQSRQFLSQAINLSGKLGDRLGLGTSYNLLGTYYERFDSLYQAGVYFDSALMIRAELGDSLGLADCLNNIGKVWLELNDLDEAYRYYQEALRIRRNQHDSSSICHTLLDMTIAFRHQQPDSTRNKWLSEARQMLTAGDDPKLKARVLQVSAIRASEEGKFDRALTEYRQALSLLEPGRYPSLRVSLLTHSASIYNALGDCTSALTDYLAALELAHATTNPSAIASILHNLGVTCQRIGENKRAITYYQRSLDLKKTLGRLSQMVQTLNNLAEIYLKLNDGDAARECLEQSHQIADSYNDPRLLAGTYIVSARVLSRFDHLDSAATIYTQLDDSQAAFDIVMMKADIRRQQGEYADATKHLDAGKTLLNRLASYSNLQKYDMIAGQVFYDTKQFDSAYAYLARVIGRLERTRKNIPDPQLRAQRQSRNRFAYEKMVSIFFDRYRKDEGAALDSMIHYLELAKSRTLLDLLNRSRLQPSSRVPDSLLSEEVALLTEIEQIEQLHLGVTNRQRLDSAAVLVMELNQQLSEVRLKISLADPRSHELFYPNRREVLPFAISMLDDKSAVLDYLLTPEGSLLLVITRDKKQVFQLANREQITHSLIDYLNLLRESAKPEKEKLRGDFEQSARNLADQLLSDFKVELADFERLYISADGPLAVLPFGSLIVGDKFLIEYASLTYLPSLFFLAEDEKEAGSIAGRRLLAVADPQFHSGMASLPHSRREVEWIASCFAKGNTKILTGADAAKSFLLSDKIAHFDYVHFATHSQINHDDPTRSKLLLSPDTSLGGSAYLTLREVMTLSLDADLVVLSSCESGQGRYHLGEGLEGFVRGFMYAGAANVVVSLWAVEDFASSIFMKHFYQHLDQGYAGALRQAKLDMLNSARRKHRHPFYWAPFVLVKGK